LKMLRERGVGGKLYGLAPTFNSKALFYNVDLFGEYGIDPPTDSMSWEEVLNLARRFPKDGDPETKAYGLTVDLQMTASDFIRDVGRGTEYIPDRWKFRIIKIAVQVS